MSSSGSKWILGAVLSTGVAAALPPAALAQINSSPQQSGLAQARKAVVDARVDLTRSKTALQRARQRVEGGFGKANPGYAAAQRTYEKALTDVKSVTGAALAGLQKKPEYLEALKAKQAAKDKQTALAADSKATEDDRQAAFNDVCAKVQALTDMENTVTQADPRIVDAKQRLADARQALDDFKSQIDAACAADPEYQQAQQAEASDEQRVAQAQSSLQQQEKAAQAAAAAAAAAAARSRTPPPAPPR